jgi:ribA/ribD-fused uncharacterized protein
VKQITLFRGDYAFLSNFYNCKIEYNNLVYENAESAFQAQKCTTPLSRYLYCSLSAKEAKKRGRLENLRVDWMFVKDKIMEEVVFAKFSQNEDLKKRLLDTGDLELIEGNNWHDCEWGVCTCVKCCGKEKKNKLGKILMQVREEIRNGEGAEANSI